ncbi:MAG: DUF4434 domain-containing protein [Clostridia bacterium]|nr:DUF4434 domain-containing protein [Clostridia bacterium]
MAKRAIALIAALAMLIYGGIVMTSCTGNDANVSGPESTDPGETETSKPVRKEGTLAAEYYYAAGTTFENDGFRALLTDFDDSTYAMLKAGSDDIPSELKANDWAGAEHTIEMPAAEAAVVFDFGFICRVDEIKTAFAEEFTGYTEVFASTDGYNFTLYKGTLEEAKNFEAKAVMLRFGGTDGVIKLSGVDFYGEQPHEKILLSPGCAYTFEGTGLKRYSDADGSKLTDGKTFAASGEEALAGRLGTGERDPVNGKSCSTVIIDLGEVKNVSEVAFDLFAEKGKEAPEPVQIRYSENGTDYADFGQGRALCGVKEEELNRFTYKVTRFLTVKARYIKLWVPGALPIITDEIRVCGAKESVDDFVYRAPDEGFSFTNVAAYKSASAGGKVLKELTDMHFEMSVPIGDGIVIDLTDDPDIEFDTQQGLCGAALYTNIAPTRCEVYAVNGESEELLESEFTVYQVAGKQAVYITFAETAAAKLRIAAMNEYMSKAMSVYEAEVFANQPQAPIVNGGFFQIATGEPTAGAGENDEYSWYLQLKGMADLGMKYVVLQYSAKFNEKTVLFEGENLAAAGYTYTPGRGTADMPMAILNAAEKLGMKVWLGTIHDSDFTAPLANKKQYEAIAADAKIVIKDIHEKYGSHPAFAGYYLSDETCDAWLAIPGGVEACRYIYESQSDYIRALDYGAKIMIAPAIWRSGSPQQSADNLYAMLAPREQGGRPVVDIVAAQDCLGRLNSLTVDTATFNDYMRHAACWAEAVRAAGCEFWHDAEVFETTGLAKRAEEVRNSVQLEALVSGATIVFDIPHYFTMFQLFPYNNAKQYYETRHYLEYAKYYAEVKEGIKTYGEILPYIRIPNPFGETELPPEQGGDEPGEITGSGDITRGKPGFADLSGLNFMSFTLGNGSGNKPEYAFSCDEKAFYIILKTNDTTESCGAGLWWEGKDDLVQVWAIGAGRTAGDALQDADGIRFYVHSTSPGKIVCGGEFGTNAAAYASYAEAERKDGVYIITLPWELLGVQQPQEGSGAKIAVNIQYIDGADGSWAASKGNKGRSLTANELYEF